MAAKPKDMLVYYGYLNSFNSGVNGWSNEAVALDMAKYDVLVFGDGVQDPTHPDYANTSVIIPRLKVLKPDALIFGYVSANQSLANFQTKASQWDNLEINGIFIDEAGYDFGVSRADLNNRVSYIRSLDYAVISYANSWNMDHIIGTTNDPSYPNSTYNPSLTASLLDSRDYYLLESFVVNTLSYSGNAGYATQSDFLTRGNKAINLSNEFGINITSLNVINNDNTSGQNLANFSYNAAVMYNVEFSGTSDVYYGASSATVKFWNRPNKKHIGRTSTISVTQNLSDTDVCLRYGEHARVLLDFSTGAQTSVIETW